MKNGDLPINPLANDQVYNNAQEEPWVDDTKPMIGLTKREYFASKAMQGLLSDVHVGFWMKTDPRFTGENFADVVAINSLEFADALLKRLES